MQIITETNGLILFLIGLFHLIYVFFSGSKSIIRYIDIIAILLGIAIWQYPERAQAILKIVIHSSN